MDTTDKALLAIGATLFALILALLGHEIGRKSVRKEALLLGHAHYVTDNDGDPQFTWKK